MLETPKMKLVKLNNDYIPESSLNLQDIYSKFLEDMESQLKKAEEEIIREFAEKEDLSLKCAKYFINRHFNFKLEIVDPDSLLDTPTVAVTLVPKSPEEILHDIDTLPMTNELNECERELLEKHSNDKF